MFVKWNFHTFLNKERSVCNNSDNLFLKKRNWKVHECYIRVHEGYILIHEGYIPVHAGCILVHEGYISIYEVYIQET